MDDLIINIEKLNFLTSEEHDETLISFYKSFAKLKALKANELEYNKALVPRINSLLQKDIIRKDLLLLTLIATENSKLLEKLMECDKKSFHLNLEQPATLYNFCIFQKLHWIAEIIHNLTIENNGSLYSKFSNKMIVLSTLNSTINEFNVTKMITVLKDYEEHSEPDGSLNAIVSEINRSIDIINFCKMVKADIDEKEVFNVLCNKNILDTLSIFINLEDSKIWPLVCAKVIEHDEDNSNCEYGRLKDSDHFELFTIFATLFNISNVYKQLPQNTNSILNDIKDKLLKNAYNSIILDLLEDIFAIIFVTEKQMNESDQDILKNNEIIVRSILYLVKAIYDVLLFKNPYSKGTEDYDRFTKLGKFIHDAYWRMELVLDVKRGLQTESPRILYYMLAPATSLLTLCLKCGNFERAQQVIQIFNMEDSEIAKEVIFTRALRNLRNRCGKYLRTKGNISNAGSQENEADFKVLITDFLEISSVTNEEECSNDAENPNKINYLSHYESGNEKFMNLIDILVTQTLDVDMSKVLLHLVNENNTLNPNIISPYSKFCQNIVTISESVILKRNITICNLILSSDTPFDKAKYEHNHDMNEKLITLCDQFRAELDHEEPGFLNINHKAHKTFGKLEILCNSYNSKDVETVNYLSKLYNYLKAFSKVLYIGQNTSDLIAEGKNTNFFKLLDYNRSELMGQLLFEKHLDPTEFETYFSKMKLDFLYHLAGNCFPTINLHTEEFITQEELFPENNLYIPTQNIIRYIMKRNWLLALILKEMYDVPNIRLDINESRIQVFLNYKNLKTTQNLICIYDNNEIITALQHEISIRKVRKYMDPKISRHENMYTSQLSIHSNQSLESAEEMIEDSLKTVDWKELFEVLNSISEIEMKKSKEMRDLKDFVVCKLINDRFEFEFFKYIYQINSRDKRIDTILNNLANWPADFCLNLIKAELSNSNQHTTNGTEELNVWLNKIQLCSVLSKLLNLNNWRQAIVQNDVQNTLRILVNNSEVDQLLLFIDVYKPSEETLEIINEDYFVTAFSKGCPFSHLRQLLNKMPYQHSMNLCYKLIKIVTDIDALCFLVNYLTSNSQHSNLKQIQISLKMLMKLSNVEREQLLCLINKPLDIIEVLLMNTKFDKLSTLLEVTNSDIPPSDHVENSISIESIDRLLRKYAEKSLDFRVISQVSARRLRTPESKLIESLDSSDSDKKEFYMPVDVPTKDQWVPNNEVLECMCCQNVTFSMFSRRHHCRRCGRVVCSTCSMKKMQVPSYGKISVRVCIDCYELTMEEVASSERSDVTSVKSCANENWLLSDDEENNKIVREDFSYEYAPSVSLCLSILKHHSHTVAYPKFLLEQCNNILKVLVPTQDMLQEIDYLLVIKMLKSLAMASKVMSQECAFHQGTLSAERLLIQAELLGLFSERGCLNLLPVSSSSKIPNIDTMTLRRLRDKLLENEQWNLALEVSTKSGLDGTGVFAAWGKSCLKAGCLTKAREKFQRCLDKRKRYGSHSDSISETDNVEDGSDSGSNRSLNKSTSEFFEKKPLKNPPLLNEIIQILESKTAVIDRNIVDEVNISGISASISTLNQSSSIVVKDPAISILNKLRNLDYIASGKYYFPTDRRVQTSYATNRPIVDTVFYNECIFYLSRYGSHQSLLEFYLKHGELDQALQYILDNNMSGELFIEIYMRCLKDGLVNILQENIAKLDSTLDMWKNYLRQLCRHLEKQKLLNSLYQLQLFMGDYMRAAMTCIKFYQENTNNFSDMARKNNFLHKAEEHLKQIHEQEQWVEVAPVRKISASSIDTYEEKSITNPSLVMKLDTKNISIYLNTIWRQNEVASFLADCEAAGMQPIETLKSILPEDSDAGKGKVPTLFGTNMDKARLTILILVTSVEIEQGFKIALRLIEDFKLRPGTVYCQTGKHLAKMQKYDAIVELVQCIKMHSDDKTMTEICDEMLTLAVATLTKEKAPAAKVEDLIKLIADKGTKISAYIEAKQLKTAYLFAVRFKRMSDIRRILREAELNNQPNIKALCMKILQANTQLPSNTKE